MLLSSILLNTKGVNPQKGSAQESIDTDINSDSELGSFLDILDQASASFTNLPQEAKTENVPEGEEALTTESLGLLNEKYSSNSDDLELNVPVLPDHHQVHELSKDLSLKEHKGLPQDYFEELPKVNTENQLEEQEILQENHYSVLESPETEESEKVHTSFLDQKIRKKESNGRTETLADKTAEHPTSQIGSDADTQLTLKNEIAKNQIDFTQNHRVKQSIQSQSPPNPGLSTQNISNNPTQSLEQLPTAKTTVESTPEKDFSVQIEKDTARPQEALEKKASLKDFKELANHLESETAVEISVNNPQEQKGQKIKSTSEPKIILAQNPNVVSEPPPRNSTQFSPIDLETTLASSQARTLLSKTTPLKPSKNSDQVSLSVTEKAGPEKINPQSTNIEDNKNSTMNEAVEGFSQLVESSEAENKKSEHSLKNHTSKPKNTGKTIEPNLNQTAFGKLEQAILEDNQLKAETAIHHNITDNSGDSSSQVHNIKSTTQIHSGSINNLSLINPVQSSAIDSTTNLSRPAQPSEPHPVTTQVLDEVISTAQSGKQEVTLHLRPDHLGDVRINLSSNSEQIIHTRMIVQSAEVKEVLESQINTLQKSLESQGITIEKIQVILAGSNDLSSGSASQEQEFGQQNHPSQDESQFEQWHEQQPKSWEQMNSSESFVNSTNTFGHEENYLFGNSMTNEAEVNKMINENGRVSVLA